MFQYFLFISISFYFLLFNSIALALFQKNGFLVIWCWLKSGNNIVGGLFFGFLFGLVFCIVLAQLFDLVYQSLTGVPSVYVYVGDNLKNGIFVYQENDTQRTVLTASELMSSDNLRSTFNNLYERVVLMRSPSGELMRLDSFAIGSIIKILLLMIVSFVFSLIGISLLIGGILDKEIADVIDLIRHQATREIVTVLLVLFVFMGSAVFIIRRSVGGLPPIPAEISRAVQLPQSLKVGKKLSGKILQKQIHTSSSGKSTTWRTWYFLVELKDDFNPPVYMNYTFLEKSPTSIKPREVIFLAEKLDSGELVKFFVKADEDYPNQLVLELENYPDE